MRLNRKRLNASTWVNSRDMSYVCNCNCDCDYTYDYVSTSRTPWYHSYLDDTITADTNTNTDTDSITQELMIQNE
jgi:hypothetical protein